MKEYRFRINGHDYEVGVGASSGNMTEVIVNGVRYEVENERQAAEKPAAAKPAVSMAAAAPVPRPSSSPVTAGKGRPVTSPLPGVMLEIGVTVGEKVKAGQKVAVLEAMKMENDIQAENDGTVTAIFVAKGESVLEGATIMTIS